MSRRKGLLEMVRKNKVPPTNQTAETVWNQSATYTLTVHNTDFSQEEVIVNPEIFKSIKEEERLEIEVCNESSSGNQRKFIVQTGKNILNDTKVKYIQISLIKAIADLFEIDKKAQVKVVRLTNISDYAIESIRISFKDSFFSRRDMRLIEQYLKSNRQILYKNKVIDYEEQSFRIRKLKLRISTSKTGVVDNKTKFRYYSRSCEAYWIIEISKELYEYSNDGYILYENIVDFVKRAFEEFKLQAFTHNITLLAAGKMYYSCCDYKDGMGIEVESSGRIYRNFFHKLFTVQSFKGSTKDNILTLKKILAEYPDRLNWEENRKEHIVSFKLEPYKNYNGIHLGKSELSNSENFCILEALNICYKEFTMLGRQSLEHTGRQVMILSPGKGVYEVSKELSNITKHLYRSSDCNVDLFAFGNPPLHIAPLFYTSQTRSDKKGVLSKNFIFPYWITLQFIKNELFIPKNECKVKYFKSSTPTPEEQTGADKFEVEAEALWSLKQEIRTKQTSLQKPSEAKMEHEKFEELYFTTELNQKPDIRQRSNHIQKSTIITKDSFMHQRLGDRIDNLPSSNEKEAFNPFVPWSNNNKHYKGYHYWLICREREQDFSRLFSGVKKYAINPLKYLYEVNLFPIEIDDFIYSEVTFFIIFS